MKKSSIFMRLLAVVLAIALLLPSMVVVGSAGEMYGYDSVAGESEGFDIIVDNDDLLFDDDYPLYNGDGDLLCDDYDDNDLLYGNDDLLDLGEAEDEEDEYVYTPVDDEPIVDEGLGAGNYFGIAPLDLNLFAVMMEKIIDNVQESDLQVFPVLNNTGLLLEVALSFLDILNLEAYELAHGLELEFWTIEYTILDSSGSDVSSGISVSTDFWVGHTLAPPQNVLDNMADYTWCPTLTVIRVHFRTLPTIVRGTIVCEETLNPLPGVTVRLYDYDPGPLINVGGPPDGPRLPGTYVFTNLTEVTGVDGRFDFDEVPFFGRLKLSFPDTPSGYNPRDDYPFVVAAGGIFDETIKFEPIPPIIAGRVECEETGLGIPNVTVRLYDDDGNLVEEVKTDANGEFEFGLGTVQVPIGDLEIRFPDFHGYETPDDYPITTAPGSEDDDLIFRFVPIPPTLRGTITCEGTGNPIQRVTVTLYDSNNVVVATRVTGANGSYNFGEIPVGNFVIRLSNIPAGYNAPRALQLATVLGGVYVKDFEIVPIPPTLKGVITCEMTGNPIPGVIVTLYDSNNVVVATRVTGPDGSYNFGNIPIGDLEIRFSNIPPGYNAPANHPLTTAPGGEYNVNFGFAPIPPTLRGTIRCKETGNPTWGVAVTLYSRGGIIIAATTTGRSGFGNSNIVVARTRTDAYGAFDFGEVPFGDLEIGLPTFPNGVVVATPRDLFVTTVAGGEYEVNILLTSTNHNTGNNNNNRDNNNVDNDRDNDRTPGSWSSLPGFRSVPTGTTYFAAFHADADCDVYHRVDLPTLPNTNMNPATGGFAERTFINSSTSENEYRFRTVIAIFVLIKSSILALLIRREEDKSSELS